MTVEQEYETPVAHKDQQQDSKYMPLTDKEWLVVEQIVGSLVDAGEVRRGRPRVNCRMLLNAIAHAISKGVPIKNIGSSTLVYPSRPTLSRYYKVMVLSGMMNQFVLHLSVSRPEFLQQYLQYSHRIKGCPPTPPTEEQLRALIQPEPEPVRGNYGIISPVPWGPPGGPARA